jgi:hypothetical protein
MDPSVIVEFFNFIDTDHDGFITVDEIKEACAVDIDQNGVITEAEKLQCARVWLQDKLPLQDLNGDQKISLDELLAYART